MAGTHAVLEQLSTLLKVGELVHALEGRIALHKLLARNRVGDQLENAVGHRFHLEITLELKRLIEPLEILNGQFARWQLPAPPMSMVAAAPVKVDPVMSTSVRAEPAM